jgi:hypothetical protein
VIPVPEQIEKTKEMFAGNRRQEREGTQRSKTQEARGKRQEKLPSEAIEAVRGR